MRLLPSAYHYDVRNVSVVHGSFMAPSAEEIASHKACAELTLSTVATWLRTDLLACFRAMLAHCSVADRDIYAKPNKSRKKPTKYGDLRLGK